MKIPSSLDPRLARRGSVILVIAGVAAVGTAGLASANWSNRSATPSATTGLSAITVPDTTDNTVPDTTDNTVPDTTDDTVPDTTDGTVPDTTDNTVPDTTDDTVPDTTDGTVPDTTDNTVPDTTDNTVPDTSAPDSTVADPEVAPFTETYRTAGGSITVTWDGASLRLDAVSPASGFEVELDRVEHDRIRVEFEGDDDDYRIEVRVDDGELRVRVD